MMQIKRIKAAIAIMKRAAKNKKCFNMDTWQTVVSCEEGYSKTEDELHACGNTACFAGHIAISPEFHADGGSVNPEGGFPEFEGVNRTEAIAAWLGIPVSLAKSLVMGNNNESNYSMFYEKMWNKVTPIDVIKKLEAILSGDLTDETPMADVPMELRESVQDAIEYIKRRLGELDLDEREYVVNVVKEVVRVQINCN